MAFVDIYASSLTPCISAGEIDCVDEVSLARLQDLMPPGVAWNRDAGTNLTDLLRALAYAFSRVKKRGLDLLEEVDPRTTAEMLGDWERVFGLPDECEQPETVAGRRAALLGKMRGFGDPTIANITALALALGYVIIIHEYKRADMFVCTSDCQDSLFTDQWMFVWHVTTSAGETDEQLECALDGFHPLHTVLVVIFHETWPSMMMNYASGEFVTVSAPTTPPIDSRRPGADADINAKWLGIGWSPELNSSVLIGAPGTYCLEIA